MKKIPQDQVIQRLKSENIWWESLGTIPEAYKRLLRRPYIDIFFPYLENRQVNRAIVLMGPRRVGKTVLLHHAIQMLMERRINPKSICYVSVDQPLYNGLSLEAFLDTFQQATQLDYKKEECFVFFDEIQYLKNWENHLKVLVDKYPHIKCVVSGSAAAALRIKSIESGAGRFSNFLLPPLTFYEYMYLLEKTTLVDVKKSESGFIENLQSSSIIQLNHDFIHYLNFGGYPEVALSEEIQKNPGQFVKSDIIDKVLLRDLPSLYGIKDIQELNYLFTTLAFNTADEVSLEQLSQGSGIAKNTIKRYIEYLEAAFLIKTVHRVDRNAKRLKRATSLKVYLTNPSMRAALFDVSNEESSAIGQLVETAVYSQLFHTQLQLHYARWAKGEVDIVALTAGQKVDFAIEVKWSDRYVTHLNELKSVIAFCHEHNLESAMVTSRTVHASVRYQNVNINFIPASLYSYFLGYNVIHHRQLLEGLSGVA